MPLKETLSRLAETLRLKKPEVIEVSEFVRLKSELARQIPGEPQLDMPQTWDQAFLHVSEQNMSQEEALTSIRPSLEHYSETFFNTLGWRESLDQVRVDYGPEAYARIKYVVDNDIECPRSNFGYHGTNIKHLASMKEHGLDNQKGEINPHLKDIGFRVMSDHTVVTYSADIDHVRSFANMNEGDAMIIRFLLESPETLGTFGVKHEPIPPHLLQYSLDDGKTWFSLQTPIETAQAYHQAEAQTANASEAES